MVLLDECRIAKVIQQDHAIFLELEMCRYRRHNGQPVLARAKWFSSYHGAEFGDWWVPEPGQIVLAFFPNGDSSNGIAFAVAPTKGDPDLPKGHAESGDGEDDSRAPSRELRVHRGRPGEALDVLRQGEVRLRISGDLESKVTGDHDDAVDGDRSTKIGGDLTLDVGGDREIDIGGSDEKTVVGDETVTVVGATTQTRVGQNLLTLLGTTEVASAGTVTIIATVGGLTVEAAVTITGSLDVAGPIVLTGDITHVGLAELGGPGARLLVDERLIEAFNNHEHAELGQGAVKSQHQIGDATSGKLPVVTEFVRAS